MAGMVALGFAAPVHAGTGVEEPTASAAHRAAQKSPRGTRPVVAAFEATSDTPKGGTRRVEVQYRIVARSSSVRVRLSFAGLADGSTYRVSLGRRKTGVLHTYTSTDLPAADPLASVYRVRIVARGARGKGAVRSVTSRPSTALPASSHGRFPVSGTYHIDGAGGQFGAPRGTRVHQGQDISAPEGTPVIAPTSGTIYWRAYQAAGAGYYLVLESDATPYYFAFLHLQQGSLLVNEGDHVQAGQRIASVGNTGRSFGAHLHFEVWQGVWFGGGKPIDPLPLLRSWEGAA